MQELLLAVARGLVEDKDAVKVTVARTNGPAQASIRQTTRCIRRTMILQNRRVRIFLRQL